LAIRRDAGWEVATQYSEEQVDAVLTEIGVRTLETYADDFLGFCPFHGNNSTPSFAVSKNTGLYVCYNPACGASGTLLEMVMKIGGKNPFEAARIISKNKSNTGISFEERLAKELAEEPEWVPFSQEVLARCHEEFWHCPKALEYMHGRHFEDETLQYFRIGYSGKRDAIMVPMHNGDGLPIGVIGRSLIGKDFKNSKGLPKNKTAWNYHRAKREGDTVIICEASFDAMRIHQAGYRNVVALLGGTFSPYQQQQLGRTFNNIVIMTDFDKRQFNKDCAKCKREGSKLCKGHNPGEDLGASIAFKMRGKRVLWAHHGGLTRFPEGVKDAGDMTDTMIRHCIQNAISNVEYVLED
jgi:DNA primase